MLKLVRRTVLLFLLVATGAGAYLAAPFHTAWTIREAVRNNDSPYLERKIEWPQVRATLKESLSTYALTTPAEFAAPSENPGWWRRMKAYFGKGAIDRFVEATVTPTGLNGVMAMRRTYAAATSGADPDDKRPLIERIRGLWSRVTRAEFTRIDRLELEIVDKLEPARTVACALELKGTEWGFEWKLTELRVKPTGKADVARLELAAQ